MSHNFNTFHNGQSLLSRLKDLQTDLPLLMKGKTPHERIDAFWDCLNDRDFFTDGEYLLVGAHTLQAMHTDESREAFPEDSSSVEFYSATLSAVLVSLDLIDKEDQ